MAFGRRFLKRRKYQSEIYTVLKTSRDFELNSSPSRPPSSNLFSKASKLKFSVKFDLSDLNLPRLTNLKSYAKLAKFNASNLAERFKFDVKFGSFKPF